MKAFMMLLMMTALGLWGVLDYQGPIHEAHSSDLTVKIMSTHLQGHGSIADGSSISLSSLPAAQPHVQIKATFENIGKAPSPKVTYYCRCKAYAPNSSMPIHLGQIQEEKAFSISGSETVSLSFNLKETASVPDALEYKYECYADAMDVASELDESNNKVKLTFKVNWPSNP